MRCESGVLFCLSPGGETSFMLVVGGGYDDVGAESSKHVNLPRIQILLILSFLTLV